MSADRDLASAPRPADAPASRPPAVVVVQLGARAGLPIGARLERLGIAAVTVRDVAEALRRFGQTGVELCLIDLSADRAAVTAVRLIRARYPHLPMAGVVDAAQPAAAAEALAAGLTDVLPWPCEDGELALIAAHARETAPVRGADAETDEAGLVAYSSAMRAVLARLRALAPTGRHVSIVGEPGSGRVALGRALHRLSGGRPGGFVTIDAAGGADVSGAADAAAAAGGTLLIAAPGDMPARTQVRLAQVLRAGDEERRQGSAGTPSTRLILVNEEPLGVLVADGKVREELAGLVTAHLEMPPLRKRREDIATLAVRFAGAASDRRRVPRKAITRSALAVLAALPWPGNARELARTLDGLVGATDDPVIRLDDLLERTPVAAMAARCQSGLSLREARAAFERQWITAALVRCHGRAGDAARALGIQRTNLYRKVRQLGLPASLLSARRS